MHSTAAMARWAINHQRLCLAHSDESVFPCSVSVLHSLPISSLSYSSFSTLCFHGRQTRACVPLDSQMILRRSSSISYLPPVLEAFGLLMALLSYRVVGLEYPVLHFRRWSGAANVHNEKKRLNGRKERKEVKLEVVTSFLLIQVTSRQAFNPFQTRETLRSATRLLRPGHPRILHFVTLFCLDFAV